MSSQPGDKFTEVFDEIFVSMLTRTEIRGIRRRVRVGGLCSTALPCLLSLSLSVASRGTAGSIDSSSTTPLPPVLLLLALGREI